MQYSIIIDTQEGVPVLKTQWEPNLELVMQNVEMFQAGLPSARITVLGSGRGEEPLPADQFLVKHKPKEAV